MHMNSQQLCQRAQHLLSSSLTNSQHRVGGKWVRGKKPFRNFYCYGGVNFEIESCCP